MTGEQLLGEVHHHRCRGQAFDAVPCVGRTAEPVVLHHELVDALERVGLAFDALGQEVRRRPDRLLEEGEKQLVLAAEVLVEEAQRLAGVGSPGTELEFAL